MDPSTLASASNTVAPSNTPSHLQFPTNSSLSQYPYSPSTNQRSGDIHQFTNPDQETIIQLRIRIAVLESNLAHTQQERDAGLRSLPIIIEALTRHASTHSSPPYPSEIANPSNFEVKAPEVSASTALRTRKVEAEIERLRRENRALRANIKDNGRNEATNNQDAECMSINVVHYVSQGSQTVVEDVKKSNPKTSNGAMGTTSQEAIPATPTSSNKDYNVSPVGSSWGSFETQATIPNTRTPTNPSFQDIGMNTLEENMSDSASHHAGFPASILAALPSPPPPTTITNTSLTTTSPPPATPTPASATQGGFEELEKSIDEQLADDIASTLTLHPAPTILKIGFSLDGNKRGLEYDASHPHPHPFPLQPGRNYRHSSPSQTTTLWRDPISCTQAKRERERGGERTYDPNMWTSPGERNAAVQNHQALIHPSGPGRFSFNRRNDREERSFPDFFRYGIQFVPGAEDTNLMRTVHISNLPFGTHLNDVLQKVRGGMVVGAVLMDTIKLTGSLAVRVVFMEEMGAEAFVEYAGVDRLIFDGKLARVEVVDTPTYPMNTNRLLSLQSKNQTRCIAIRNFPAHLLNEEDIQDMLDAISRRLKMRADTLLELYLDGEKTLHLEFSGVDIAGSAFAILSQRRWGFGEGGVVFEKDPCASAIENLENEKEMPVRQPLLVNGKLKGLPQCAGEVESKRTVDAHEQGERKPLPALSHIKVSIPSFSGEGIKSASWADEVIDEAEGEEDSSSQNDSFDTARPSNTSPASASTSFEVQEQVEVLSMGDVNKRMFDGDGGVWKGKGKMRPVGLEGSVYATAPVTTTSFQSNSMSSLGSGSETDVDVSPLLLSYHHGNKASPPRPVSTLTELQQRESEARAEEEKSEYAFNFYSHIHPEQHPAMKMKGRSSPIRSRSPLHVQEVISEVYSRQPPMICLDDLLGENDESGIPPIAEEMEMSRASVHLPRGHDHDVAARVTFLTPGDDHIITRASPEDTTSSPTTNLPIIHKTPELNLYLSHTKPRTLDREDTASTIENIDTSEVIGLGLDLRGGNPTSSDDEDPIITLEDFENAALGREYSCGSGGGGGGGGDKKNLTSRKRKMCGDGDEDGGGREGEGEGEVKQRKVEIVNPDEIALDDDVDE